MKNILLTLVFLCIGTLTFAGAPAPTTTMTITLESFDQLQKIKWRKLKRVMKRMPQKEIEFTIDLQPAQAIQYSKQLTLSHFSISVRTAPDEIVDEVRTAVREFVKFIKREETD
ncbi:MAG: hypothetical protein AAFO94_04705 [Bacteroidota bacterium]